MESLSIPMLCIQSPGLFFWAFFVAARNTEWYIYITYLCAGILQTVLLVICIIWRIRETQEDTGHTGVLRDETVTLLENADE